MILEDLYEYYESKPKADPCAKEMRFDEVCPLFWTVKKVSWEISITSEGEYVSCISLVGPKEKGGVPKILPSISRSSAVRAFVFADNAKYVFGADPKRGVEKRRDFIDKQRAVLEGVDDEAARAFLCFIEKDPYNNGIPSDVRAQLSMDESLIAFRLESDPFWCEIQNRPALAEAWKNYAMSMNKRGSNAMCLVTGEVQPVAEGFPLITGVSNANPSGASLVSFNKEAFRSYGKDKASISKSSAFKCGEALRYLLKSDDHCVSVGQDSVIFWTGRDRQPDIALLNLCLGGEDFGVKTGAEDKDVLDAVKRRLELVRSGRPLPDIDLDEHYHVLGIAPYQARLAVRFYEEGTLGELQENLASFLRDTQMINVRHCSMKGYLEQTAPLGDRNNIPSPLITSCMHALIKGGPFPEALFEQLLARMRADHGSRKQWDMGCRAAMMRAHLVRRERLSRRDDKGYESVPAIAQTRPASYRKKRLWPRVGYAHRANHCPDARREPLPCNVEL